MYTNPDTSDKELTEEITFGKWLRQRRRSLDLSQQAFADKVGCARITLSRIEAGTLKPSKQLALLLLEKAGIPQTARGEWLAFARGQAGLPFQMASISNPKPRTNLPASLTSFIGREKEQVEIIQLLSKHRLVTLIGSGGVGKTRLSLKVGEQLLGNYSDGVWLVELAPLTNPELLIPTIASVFNITSTSNIPLAEILINALRVKTTLLILDNCEHLLDACTRWSDTLLKNCPNLKILATSREAMGILGEVSYRVPSLGLPNVQQVLEKLRGFESMRLFEERAQLVQTDFSLTLENASSIAQICSRLDGIPLALELAAVRVNMLSPAEIAAQLAECFQILTGGNRAALPRQQTIRASIDWSWNLLSDSERILLQRLSVFAGGWTLEDAKSVCGENEIPPSQVMDLLLQLVNKSLVMVNQAGEHETRYHFHEIVRQYAQNKLIESPEVEDIRTHHLKYFAQLVERAESALRGSEQSQWYARLYDARDNIRSALAWADETDVEAGLYMSSRLGARWNDLDLYEGLNWLGKFLEKAEASQYPLAKVNALLAKGYLLHNLNKLEAALITAQKCLTLCRTERNQPGELDSLVLLAQSVYAASNIQQAIEFSHQALELARTLGDRHKESQLLFRLGYYDSDFTHALQYMEQAIAIHRQSEDWRQLAGCLSAAGERAMLHGKTQLAESYLKEAISLYRKIKAKMGLSAATRNYARIAFKMGDVEAALKHIQESIEIYKETNNRMGYLWARSDMGYFTLWQKSLADAQSIFQKTAQDFLADGISIGVVFNLEGMSGYYLEIDRPENTSRLIGWADATRKEIKDPRLSLEQADVDKIIAACIEKMGEAAFADAYDEGKKMTMDEALNLALNENQLLLQRKVGNEKTE